VTHIEQDGVISSQLYHGRESTPMLASSWICCDTWTIKSFHLKENPALCGWDLHVNGDCCGIICVLILLQLEIDQVRD
jgi:hypothetical protein